MARFIEGQENSTLASRTGHDHPHRRTVLAGLAASMLVIGAAPAVAVDE